MPTLLSREQFLERAHNKHGYKFDYSQVNYVKAKDAVRIHCPEHGFFEQTPDKHLQSKYGCAECWESARVSVRQARLASPTNLKKRVPPEQFLTRLNLPAHLSIDMSNYIGLTMGTVTVHCPIHGNSDYIPEMLLRVGSRCPRCGNARQARSMTKSFDNFMEKLQAVHGSKYEVPYPEEYENRKSMLTLVCETHGVFSKRAQKALAGQGCGRCRHEELIADGTLSGGYSERLFAEKPELAAAPATIYYLRVGPVWKVGITRNKLVRRLDHIRSASKLPVELLDSHECILEEAFRLEQVILQDFHLVRTYEMWSSEVFSQDVLNGVSLVDYANAIEL